MANPLDPNLIPKYVNNLVIPPEFFPTIANGSFNYTVTMAAFNQQILPPPFNQTYVWGYQGTVVDPVSGVVINGFQSSSPGPTFNDVRGIPSNVQWINNITDPNPFAVDPTIHWANPNNMPMPMPPFEPFPPGYNEAQSPVPLVTHRHGGEHRSDFDGGPDSWFTAGEAIKGPEFFTSLYTYPNQQEPTTLWYHDHALGVTRLNVYAGLAGFYLIQDPTNPVSSLLPNGLHDIPIVIQDRSFFDDGSLLYPANGVNPNNHPYWVPEFFGNTIMTNGRVWPNLDVERRQYRFRLLNGSNARFYALYLSNGQDFTQIGSDGGFLANAVILNQILLSPAERADILIDFSLLSPGTQLTLNNIANAPYPDGEPPDANTGQIMQFTVLNTPVVPPTPLPPTLNNIPKLIPDVPNKILTLVEELEPDTEAPLEILLDGQLWTAPVSELPIVGSTVLWEIVNLTADAHPIHVHLIMFQLLNRQDIDGVAYFKDWNDINGPIPLDHPTIPLPLNNYVIGSPIDPPPNESGWKDTVVNLPNQVTRFLLRWAPQDADPNLVKPGVNLFPFDPSFGPGYVWHCHIIEHEDNEMMRPLDVISPAAVRGIKLFDVAHAAAPFLALADSKARTWRSERPGNRRRPFPSPGKQLEIFEDGDFLYHDTG